MHGFTITRRMNVAIPLQPTHSTIDIEQSSTASTEFLGIPIELRRHIYQYCLVSPDPIIVRHLLGNTYTSNRAPPQLHTNILRVSKQITNEAMEVLYGSNTFLLFLESGATTSLEYAFTSANRLKIQRLQLVIKDNDQVWQSLRFRPMLWATILAGLKKLTIVAQQPLETSSEESASSTALAAWLSWMRPMMGYMAEQLSSEAFVEIDDNDRDEIRLLIETSFPSGYKKIRTAFGDKLFRRNTHLA